MGRSHYHPQALPEFLGALQQYWPVMGLGADILVGFPGENEAEFEETHALVKALPLTYVHVFPFSSRPGTMAATMPGHLLRETADERAATIRKLAAAKKDAFLYFLTARPQSILHMLLESRNTGLGVSEYYTSCCLSLTDLPPGFTPGAVLPVRPIRAESGLLTVEPAL
jgi:tRNA A37 methylthiotransferase MiaB